ncbi:hypothetical protein H8959_001374 [Pygathrix nigripes]
MASAFSEPVSVTEGPRWNVGRSSEIAEHILPGVEQRNQGSACLASFSQSPRPPRTCGYGQEDRLCEKGMTSGLLIFISNYHNQFASQMAYFLTAGTVAPKDNSSLSASDTTQTFRHGSIHFPS